METLDRVEFGDMVTYFHRVNLIGDLDVWVADSRIAEGNNYFEWGSM